MHAWLCVCVRSFDTVINNSADFCGFKFTFKLHYDKCIQRNYSCAETRERETDTDLDWERETNWVVLIKSWVIRIGSPAALWLTNLEIQTSYSSSVSCDSLQKLFILHIAFHESLGKLIHYLWPRKDEVTLQIHVMFQQAFFFFVSILKTYSNDKLIASPDSVISCFYLTKHVYDLFKHKSYQHSCSFRLMASF